METVRLVAQRRTKTGKGPARRLRSNGQLPAVVYGHGTSEAIAVDSKELMLIRLSETGANTIIDLAIADDPGVSSVILRELQIDPLSREQVHADFYRVAMDEPIVVTVPLIFINEPVDRLKAVQAVVSYLMRDLEVSCLPRDIPETITVDLQDVHIGTVLTVADIVLAQGITLITSEEEAVVTTASATMEIEAEAEVGEEDDMVPATDTAGEDEDQDAD